MYDWTIGESFTRLIAVRRSNNYAEKTIQNHLWEFRKLATFFGADRKIRSITPEEMQTYLMWRSTTLAPASMNKAADLVIEWIKFCEQAGAGLSLSLLANWRRSPEPALEHVFIPKEDIPRILDVAGDRHPRDRALIALLWYSGVRSAETLDLTVHDVDMARMVLTVNRSKVHDIKRIPMEPGFVAEMRRWFRAYAQLAGVAKLQDKWSLIPASGSGILTGRIYPDRPLKRPRYVVRDVLLAAAYPEGAKLGTHTLRRSAGTAVYDSLVEAGVPDALNRARIFLGHEAAHTTERYLNRSDDDRIARDTADRGMLTVQADLDVQVALAPVFSILSGKRITA